MIAGTYVCHIDCPVLVIIVLFHGVIKIETVCTTVLLVFGLFFVF